MTSQQPLINYPWSSKRANSNVLIFRRSIKITTMARSPKDTDQILIMLSLSKLSSTLKYGKIVGGLIHDIPESTV